MAQNQFIEMVRVSQSDLMKEYPKHRREARQDLQLLNAQKIWKHKAKIENIKSVFLAILRDIKKYIDNGEPPEGTAITAMLQTMKDTSPSTRWCRCRWTRYCCNDCRTDWAACSNG